MSDVRKKLTKLLEDWLIDPTQVDTLAMIPVTKEMRPETKFYGEDWDIAIMNESDLIDFEKIYDKSNASS